ncbi:DNA-binding protein P3A2-like isoform X2 [Tachypleus tridentatus]|uniref:DNA-binding protein P3A2-like isoform X2 n=2 Tax=Tachypleus tridentatus TaxID=6853 RepID=UPI003FD13C07
MSSVELPFGVVISRNVRLWDILWRSRTWDRYGFVQFPNLALIMTANLGSTINHSMIRSESLNSGSSSPESHSFDDSDLLSSSTVGDDVTAQLAAAGPVGVAAAAAIASGKKRHRSHSFEMNPSLRKRQQTRLIRKLKTTIDEYSTRVGQQAVALIVTPGKPHNNFKVFGAHPLENVIRNCRQVVMQELDTALAQQAPPQNSSDPTLHELPPLVVDGIPTPVEKMTQAQLRAFVPLMLKYSTGRGKPGWGKDSTRPVWWPKDLPWANVRSDARSEEEKQKVSWTHALRQIVINCYKYHGREDLLPTFTEEVDNKKIIDESQKTSQAPAMSVDRSLTGSARSLAAHYTPAVVQTISNPDGTVSIIHIDPGSAVITLPDGTQAQVRTVNEIQGSSSEENQNVQSLTEIAAASHPEVTNQHFLPLNVSLHGDMLATLTEATLNQDGQIIFTGEDGTQNAFPVSGVVTIPVSMYRTVVSSMSNLTDGQVSHPGLHVRMANLGTAECTETQSLGIVNTSERAEPVTVTTPASLENNN